MPYSVAREQHLRDLPYQEQPLLLDQRPLATQEDSSRHIILEFQFLQDPALRGLGFLLGNYQLPPPVQVSAPVQPVVPSNQAVVPQGTFGSNTGVKPDVNMVQTPPVSTSAGDRSILSRVAFGPDRVAALGDAGAYVAENYGGEILAAGVPFAYA